MADLKLTVTINDTDQLVLKNDLSNIDDWVQSAVAGKVNHEWKIMQDEWITKLMNDDSYTDKIPSNKADFVALVTGRDDYKDRAEREAENTPE